MISLRWLEAFFATVVAGGYIFHTVRAKEISIAKKFKLVALGLVFGFLLFAFFVSMEVWGQNLP